MARSKTILEFFAARGVLAKTQTALDGATNNRVLAVDLSETDATLAAQTLLEARPNDDGTGQGIVFGGALCSPGCGDVCLVADADRSVLARFAIDGDALEPLSPLAITGTVGYRRATWRGFSRDCDRKIRRRGSIFRRERKGGPIKFTIARIGPRCRRNGPSRATA